MPNPKTTLQIQINKECKDERSDSFTFELNSEDNNGKTSFVPTSDYIYLRLYPGSQQPNLWSNYGTVSNLKPRQQAEITEEVTFFNSKEATLSHIPTGHVKRQWKGKHKGTASVAIDGDTIKLSKEVTGVLECTYQYHYDLLQVHHTKPGTILITATRDEREGSTEVEYADTEEETRTVKVIFVDRCTKERIEGVALNLNNKYKGTSNSEGEINLGVMKAGHYNVITRKAGYKNSESDTIKNDGFQIA